MNRARDSDSKTHAERSNPASRTDSSSKTLRDIFLGHPVGSCFALLTEKTDLFLTPKCQEHLVSGSFSASGSNSKRSRQQSQRFQSGEVLCSQILIQPGTGRQDQCMGTRFSMSRYEAFETRHWSSDIPGTDTWKFK